MMSKSSLEHLVQLLIEECAKDIRSMPAYPELHHVSEDIVTKIVKTLEGEIFSEDNRKGSIASLDKILDPIVDQIYQEEKT
jgi:hypothetical protein